MNKTSWTLALITTLGLSGSAMAQSAEPMAFEDPGFTWDGFYAGIGFSVDSWSGGLNLYMPELVGGYNVTIDQLLVGAEATISQGLNSTGTGAFQATGKARAGLLPIDAVLVYASGGIGYYCIPNTVFGIAGAGVEFAVSDNLSLDLEYEYWYRPGQSAHTGDISLLFHF